MTPCIVSLKSGRLNPKRLYVKIVVEHLPRVGDVLIIEKVPYRVKYVAHEFEGGRVSRLIIFANKV